ncbi:MAG: hypothetical protein WC882_04245 [Candidatus Gracilibacteria bacterium]
MFSKNFLQYLYWLSKSKTFNKKISEIKYTIFNTSKTTFSPHVFLETLADEYEIPKNYRKDFNYFVLGGTLNNTETHGISEGETKNIKVKGPAIILVLKKLQSRNEFISLWENIRVLQTGKPKTHGAKKKEIYIGVLFKGQKRWRGKTDFDEVFKWYKLRKQPLPWEGVHQEVLKEDTRNGIYKETIRTAVKRLEKIINHF